MVMDALIGHRYQGPRFMCKGWRGVDMINEGHAQMRHVWAHCCMHCERGEVNHEVEGDGRESRIVCCKDASLPASGQDHPQELTLGRLGELPSEELGRSLKSSRSGCRKRAKNGAQL